MKNTLTCTHQSLKSLLTRIVTQLTCKWAKQFQFSLSWEHLYIQYILCSTKSFWMTKKCHNLNNFLVLNLLCKDYKTATIPLNTLKSYLQSTSMCLSICMQSVALKPTRSMKKHNPFIAVKSSCFCHGQRCFKYPLPHPKSDVSKIIPVNEHD